MLRLLRLIEPADKALQCTETSLCTAFPLLRSVHFSMKDYRSDEKYDSILKDCNDFLTLIENDNAEVNLSGADEQFFTSYFSLRGDKRKLKSNSQFNNFVLTKSSGLYAHHRQENSIITLL